MSDETKNEKPFGRELFEDIERCLVTGQMSQSEFAQEVERLHRLIGEKPNFKGKIIGSLYTNESFGKSIVGDEDWNQLLRICDKAYLAYGRMGEASGPVPTMSRIVSGIINTL